MPRLLTLLLLAHLGLGALLLITMDMDLGGGALRRILHHLIDAYEFLGLGVLPLGFALVTLLLGLALWRMRTRADVDA